MSAGGAFREPGVTLINYNGNKSPNAFVLLLKSISHEKLPNLQIFKNLTHDDDVITE